MSDPRGKHWTLTLSDGRQVVVGAGIDEARGVWMLNPSSPLLQHLTAADIDAIAGALRDALEHLEANPAGTSKRKRRTRSVNHG